uniref:Glycosyltransferase n=1 Tax=viral metagenome TaxID=1070528 RepID=A0A6C0DLQ4_9ZZZZ
MLYLKYNIYVDGMGAQFQRIISILALAKKYNCQYIHESIKSFEHISNDATNYVELIDEYFQIDKLNANITGIKFDNVEFFKGNTIIEQMEYYKEKSKNLNILLILDHAYNIFDKKPNDYEIIMPLLREIKQTLYLPEYNKSNKNIAIHIRRGDVSQYSNNNRYVDLSCYQTIINKLADKYKNGNLFIFTEISNNNKEEFENFIIKNKNNNINIKLMADLDILLTLEYLIKADVLVMSKSSFSYIAGLYNNNEIYYMDFWHSKLDRWNSIELDIV